MIELVGARPAGLLTAPRWMLDAASLFLLTALIGVVYVVVDAPLYNPSASIDPWVYAALFTNFDFTYEVYWNTYYASRLPWVIPGLVAHTLFSYNVAYLILHAIFLLGGGVALFVLVRRFLGRLPALVAYAALLGNQLYFTAETWDYIDGAVITYLLVSLATGVTQARGPRRVLALFAGGFFLAAAVATNIFAIVFATGFPLLYAAVNPLRGRIRRLLNDLTAFAAGGATLVAACCAFAKANGAGWWFLEPQIRATNEINPDNYRAGNYDWVVREPRLIAPLFVLVIGALVLPRLPRGDADERWRRRFAIGAYAYLLLSEAFLIVYQLTEGPVLEYPYYESLLFPALALALAAVVYGIGISAEGVAIRATLLCLAIGGAVAPLLLVYLRDSASLVGSTGTRITLAVAVVSIVIFSSLFGRSSSPRARAMLGIVGVVLLLFGINFSIATSSYIFNNAASSDQRRPIYDVGMQLIGFLREGGFQREPPFFWYRSADGPELIEVQSLYYFSYSYLGLEMPTIDNDFLTRERLFQPRTIVLLCKQSTCRGAPTALRAHGYRLHEVGRRRLKSEMITIWARVFRVDGPPTNA